MPARNPKRPVQRLVSALIENLENRRLFAAGPAQLAHGLLKINGTAHNDVIDVSPDLEQNDLLDVSVNGKVTTFQASQVQRISVNAKAGNDNVTVDSTVTDPCTILGLAGNDTLKGGGGNDVIDGGTGNDTIDADAGDDNITGGKGNDIIDAGDGNDHVQLPTGGGIPFSQAPDAVQTGLTTLSGAATIKTVQAFTEDHQSYYATLVTTAGTTHRLVVDTSGNAVTNAIEVHRGGHDIDHEAGTFGQLVSVDTVASTITVSVLSEHAATTTTTFTVTAGAPVTVGGAASSLGALPVGVRLSLQTDPANATVVTSITAIAQRNEGVVTAVDTVASTITVTPEESSTSQTFPVASDASIEINGVSGTLAGITVGSSVEFSLSPVDGQTITSLEIGHGSDDGGGGGGGGGGHHGSDN